jgi:hypothetical protein
VGLEKVVEHAGVPLRAEVRCPPGSPGTWLGVGVAVSARYLCQCAASPPLSQAWPSGEAVDRRCPLCDACGLLVWEVAGRGFRWSPEMCEGRCSALFRLLCGVDCLRRLPPWTASFCLGYMRVFVSCIVVA